MGNSYTSIKNNNFDLLKVFNRLIKGKYEVLEASEMNHFKGVKPSFNEIEDIEIGCNNSKNSIIRLNNGNYIAINKTVRLI